MRQHRLSPLQAERLETFAQRRTLFDVGSGEPTRWPVKGKVLYFDYAPYHGVTVMDFEKREDRQNRLYPLMAQHKKPVLLLSWPINIDSYTYDVTDAFDHVVYIGKNTDGNACGNDHLFNKFRRRPVLHSIGSRAHDMIIYGPLQPTFVDRPLEPDEYAAGQETVLYWEDLWSRR